MLINGQVEEEEPIEVRVGVVLDKEGGVWHIGGVTYL